VYAERQKNVELARRMRDLEAQKDEECRAAVKAECEKKQAEIDTLKDQVLQLERKLIELQITLKQEPVPPQLLECKRCKLCTFKHDVMKVIL
jgi:hypothetical protein